MVKVLKGIYSDPSLGPLLGFKGGTALYLFHNLPRFSVDLDFDLLDETKKDLVFSKVNQIVGKFAEVREKRDKFYNLFWLLSYKKGSPQLKVEINKRSFECSYELRSYLGISMLVMKKEDMFANKLIALLDRRKLANRDIFDIWFMLDNSWEVNWKTVEDRTKIKPRLYLQKCINFLEKNPPESILSGMGELLEPKAKVWTKQNLLLDTVFLLKLHLENL